MSIRITFNDSAREFILDVFGKQVVNGYVAEKSATAQRVLTPRGEEIPLEEFAGIRRGSTVFVKSDIVSIIEAVEVMA